mgnify:CR=1 FL=1
MTSVDVCKIWGMYVYIDFFIIPCDIYFSTTIHAFSFTKEMIHGQHSSSDDVWCVYEYISGLKNV